MLTPCKEEEGTVFKGWWMNKDKNAVQGNKLRRKEPPAIRTYSALPDQPNRRRR